MPKRIVSSQDGSLLIADVVNKGQEVQVIAVPETDDNGQGRVIIYIPITKFRAWLREVASEVQ